jgi:peptide/nickel transport system permease protein
MAAPLGGLGLILVVLIVLTAVLSDWITPYSPTAIAIESRFQAPSFAHPFGTDQLGRDVLSRVISGARIALETALVACVGAAAVGALIGLIAGYAPLWLDNLLILCLDTIRAVPLVMLALALVTLIGPSLNAVTIVIVTSFSPGYARIIRTQTRSLREAEFVLAARAIGAGPVRVLARHILPNVVGPLLVLTSMDIPGAITVEAGLSFLGLGVRPPTPSWGTVLNDGYAFISIAPWLIVAGGLPLVLSTLGFTFLGEAIRDAIDPRLRREP